MAEQRAKNKLSLALFKNPLHREEFETYIKQLVPNFNQNASTDFIDSLFQKYLLNADIIRLTPPSRIKLSTIGIYSKTQLNKLYWTDRGWSMQEAEFYILRRR